MTDKNVPLKPAATVLLVRDCVKKNDKIEVFMVVRHHQIDFASGALVFPGGKVDEGDMDPMLIDHLPESDRGDDPLRSFKIASIRESFEEANILLARNRETGALVTHDRLEALAEKYRLPLQNGELPIGDMVRAENLELATDLLGHFAHWITPAHMPKRFDTHFFIAKAPPHQLAAHDGEESVDSVWVGPQEVMEDADKGLYTVIFPTRMNVEALSRFSSSEYAVAHAHGTDTFTVLPQMEVTEEGKYLLIPKEAGYSVTRRRIDAIMDK
ncbi:NUDIX hydrolase [Sneathiella sp. CAU 1612]|uniref:NUDIX hydrolase n=1 Tax=Sneathiella sedimenti TaxID=2816034 RepID=A0ABS3F1S2_9PROT|nr:NUDIX hydrolase [Sneathiella sedimenti]MBO0332466.1 NUDIX hydrolase [Sneathiella sedimenti]